MTDKLTVTGTLEGITEKPTGWTVIAVTVPGKDYPVKMETKLPKLIDAARAAGTQTKEWTYTESDSGTPNPNRPGSNYVNRRFEGVADIGGGEAPLETPGNAAPPTNPAPAGHFPVPTAGDKDRLITRMSCLSSASLALQGIHAPTDEDLSIGVRVLELATRYERWVMRDIEDIPF